MMKSIIIYEDKEILVIHKPAGIATQTAKLGQADVVSELKNYLKQKGENTYLAVVHRLDQPVEGLLVFAKTQNAAKKLSADLQNGRLKKYYHALVPLQPALDRKKGHLTDYLCKDGRTNLSRVRRRSWNGSCVDNTVRVRITMLWQRLNCSQADITRSEYRCLMRECLCLEIISTGMRNLRSCHRHLEYAIQHCLPAG